MPKLVSALAVLVAGAILLTGCTVRVDRGTDRADVEVRIPDVRVSVPTGSPGSLPVDLDLPAGARSVHLVFGHAAGEARLESSAHGALSGRIGYWRSPPELTTRMDGDRFVIDLPAERDLSGEGIKVGETVLRLTDKVPVTIDLSMGAGAMVLDLTQLKTQSLSVRLGAGDVKLDLPSRANVRVRLTAGVAVNNLRQAGFERDGDTWLSPGFREQEVVEVQIHTGAGNLEVRRR